MSESLLLTRLNLVYAWVRYTFEGTTAFKRSLARLRGGLRRLNVRDPDEYDEQEYTEAATAVFQSAQVIASQSRYCRSKSLLHVCRMSLDNLCKLLWLQQTSFAACWSGNYA